MKLKDILWDYVAKPLVYATAMAVPLISGCRAVETGDRKVERARWSSVWNTDYWLEARNEILDEEKSDAYFDRSIKSYERHLRLIALMRADKLKLVTKPNGRQLFDFDSDLHVPESDLEAACAIADADGNKIITENELHTAFSNVGSAAYNRAGKIMHIGSASSKRAEKRTYK
jgi:hypothetical protein